MEDITCKFKLPCIMDVKVGSVTYDINASPAKIAREKAKFPALSDVRFQIGGIKTCSANGCKSVTLDRTYLRSLDKDTVLTKGIASFFPSGHLFHPALVHSFIRRLREIESWFTKQSSLQFYASSILLVYDLQAICDYDACRQNGATSDDVHCLWFDDKLDVRMIDFAHVYPAHDVDNNYLTGLRSLIEYFTHLTSSSYDLS